MKKEVITLTIGDKPVEVAFYVHEYPRKWNNEGENNRLSVSFIGDIGITVRDDAHRKLLAGLVLTAINGSFSSESLRKQPKKSGQFFFTTPDDATLLRLVNADVQPVGRQAALEKADEERWALAAKHQAAVRAREEAAKVEAQRIVDANPDLRITRLEVEVEGRVFTVSFDRWGERIDLRVHAHASEWDWDFVDGKPVNKGTIWPDNATRAAKAHDALVMC